MSGHLFNFARGAKVLALLFFLLPWVTVSCAGQELASISGYEMATGSVSVTNPMTGAKETPGAGERDLPTIVAAVLILAALIATFALPRSLGALIGAAGAAGAAVLIAYTVFVRVPARMRESPGGADSAGMNTQQMADMIRVDIATEAWLTLLALIAAVMLNWLSRTRSG